MKKITNQVYGTHGLFFIAASFAALIAVLFIGLTDSISSVILFGGVSLVCIALALHFRIRQRKRIQQLEQKLEKQ